MPLTREDTKGHRGGLIRSKSQLTLLKYLSRNTSKRDEKSPSNAETDISKSPSIDSSPKIRSRKNDKNLYDYDDRKGNKQKKSLQQ